MPEHSSRDPLKRAPTPAPASCGAAPRPRCLPRRRPRRFRLWRRRGARTVAAGRVPASVARARGSASSICRRSSGATSCSRVHQAAISAGARPSRARSASRSKAARKRGCSSRRSARLPRGCSSRGCSAYISRTPSATRRGIVTRARGLAQRPIAGLDDGADFMPALRWQRFDRSRDRPVEQQRNQKRRRDGLVRATRASVLRSPCRSSCSTSPPGCCDQIALDRGKQHLEQLRAGAAPRGCVRHDRSGTVSVSHRTVAPAGTPANSRAQARNRLRRSTARAQSQAWPRSAPPAACAPGSSR